MPEQGVDPFISVAQIMLGLQTIPSRVLSALDADVVSITQIHGGDAMDVTPDSVIIRGTVRCFSEIVRHCIQDSLLSISVGVAAAHGSVASVAYKRGYPATVNSSPEADKAIAAAAAVVGAGNVQVGVKPSMASEDFAFMLQACPGAYTWLGADGTGRGRQNHFIIPVTISTIKRWCSGLLTG